MSLRKELLIVGTILAVILTVILLWHPTRRITFFDLRIVNDTQRTVRVHPCWDINCINITGLPESTLRPGQSVHSSGNFATDVGNEIVVGIRKPGGKVWQFSSCMMITAPAGRQAGTVRVSKARPCFTGPEGGGGG